MASTELEPRFISLRDYIDSGHWRGLSDDQAAPPYAHPVDAWIIRTLESTPVKNALDQAIDTFITLDLGQFLAQSVAIDQKSFPDLFNLLSQCSKTLGIPIPHGVTGSVGSPVINAFTAGTDEYSFIFIFDGLLDRFSPGEAHFVIGHECGHIASKHVVYHTLVYLMTKMGAKYLGALGRLISQFAGVPLMAWSRRSEVTCDRAGLLCCGDLRTAERGLVKLVTGFADADKVDIDDYLRRYKEVSAYHGASKWEEMLMSHPMIPKRIEALRLFARSELYFDLTATPPPPGLELLSREELDRRTNQIVRP